MNESAGHPDVPAAIREAAEKRDLQSLSAYLSDLDPVPPVDANDLAQATVKPKNVLHITSIWLSTVRASSPLESTAACFASPRNQKPVPRIDSSKSSEG